jgi:hypothetical protein
MTKKSIRKFIVTNYYGFKNIKLPLIGNISFLRASPKIFLTFLLYAIFKTIQLNVVGINEWVWWDIPMLIIVFIQCSWSFWFFGLTYHDKHPITEEETKWFPEGEI